MHVKAGFRRRLFLAAGGLELSAEETAFFAEANPLGFILFQRNCDNPEQVRSLVKALRDTVGDETAPVLIDQEGGRVQRLKPPHWRAAPPQRVFAQAGMSTALIDAGLEAAYLNARLLAHELYDLGITVNCLPCLDIASPSSDPIIGDRASGRTPEEAALLGEATINGLMDGGVLPVIKHIPGHGRAKVDSHEKLPQVQAPLAKLRSMDFPPFRALKWAPCAMTAHIVYTAIDGENPATLSPRVIRDIIRGEIGFNGLLMTDDLSMKALSGDFQSRAALSLEAGCDVVLHCNGEMAEMRAVMLGTGALSQDARLRATRALTYLRQPEPLDAAAAEAQLEDFLKQIVSA